MSLLLFITIVIGIPLILVTAGFLVLVTRTFNVHDDRSERAQTLEVARQLERTLSAMESRLGALEDIILTGHPKEAPHE